MGSWQVERVLEEKHDAENNLISQTVLRMRKHGQKGAQIVLITRWSDSLKIVQAVDTIKLTGRLMDEITEHWTEFKGVNDIGD